MPITKTNQSAPALLCAALACALPLHGQVVISPAARTERVGDHLAFLGSTGGPQALSWQWYFNGTNLTGQTANSLSLANIQLTNAGTYSVQATWIGGQGSASAVLTVSNSSLPLAPTNLIVSRVGDGLQALNTTTGNTLYLDQFTSNGTYVSTVMVPDSGASALIVEGSGTSIGLDGSVLTLAADQQYLNFAGYNQSLPNGGVTFTGSSLPRAIGALDGLGNYTLCFTNSGLYNGATGQIRCAASFDGTVNTFYTGGIAASASTAIKILTPSQGPGGIPSANAGSDPRVLAIFGGNLWVSSGNSGNQAQGLYSFNGIPTGSPSTTATIQISTGPGSDPNDFAFSPDGMTAYIADSDHFTTSSGVGGIERWDYNGSSWVFNYSLSTGAGSWGTRGLTVDFSQFSGGGASARGAVVYATTAEPSTNRLIRIVDSSVNPAAAVLATAGSNQLFRGVKFGPAVYAQGGSVADLDDLNVMAFGAVGNGVADDTAAFRNALAAGQTHNGVYVPMGKYVITGTLTVSIEELVGKFTGGWPADTMPMPTLLLRNTNGPGLVLTNGASLHGIALLYDKAAPITSNAPAISLCGNGVTISSVRIQNPYDGINTSANSTPGRPRFSDIYIVSPAHVGLQVSRSYDFNHFSHIEVRCPNAMSAGPAFAFGRMDEGDYTGLAASNCLTGFEFDYDPSTNPAGGSFTGNFAGCSTIGCSNAFVINGPHKIKVMGGDFNSLSSGAIITAANEVTFDGAEWQTGAGEAIQINSATNIIIDDCMFSRPAPANAAFITATNCVALTIDHCQLLAGSTGIVIDSSVSNAVVFEDSLEDGVIFNLISGRSFVVATNLVTASPPSGLMAEPGSQEVFLSWGLAAGATNYNVKRSLASGGPYTTIATTPNLAYTDFGLTNGVPCYYVVSALRASGQSGNSSQAGAVPQAPRLNLTLGSGGNPLFLSWPSWATRFNLYSTTNLSPPIIWQPVTNPAQSNTGVFNVSLTLSNNQQFFRLDAPYP